MTQCFPPLSALVRPEPHPGDPVTAETPDKTDTDNLRATCPATHPILNALGTLTCTLPPGHPGVPAEIHLDPVHGGWCERSDAVLDAAPAQARTDQLLSRIAEAVEAVVDHLSWAARASAGSAEVIFDGFGRVWVSVGENHFECIATGVVATGDEIRKRSPGPVREFVPRPPRPGS